MKRKLLSVAVAAMACVAVASAQEQMTLFPSGVIKPQGWIEGMQNQAIAGYTGHMEEVSKKSTSRKFPHHSWVNNANGKFVAWGSLEADGYYLDGMVRLAYMSGNEALIAKAKANIDPVVDGQDEDGFFLAEAKRKGFFEANLDQGMEHPEQKVIFADDGEGATKKDAKNGLLLPSPVSRDYWSSAVFNRAVLAMYDATGEAKYINFLKKFYYMMPEFVREVDEKRYVSGMEMHLSRHLVNLEVLFEVAYRLGDKELAAKGERILKNQESGMYRSFNEKKFDYARICHGVTFNEVGKIYAATRMIDHPEYVASVENAYDFLQEEHFQPYGVNTANEYLQGIGAFNSTELCDIVDLSWSATWLARNTAKSKYGDIIEKAFFNAFPASIDHFTNHIYVFSPNRIPNVEINDRPTAHAYQHTYGPPCCTGNLNRGIPTFVQSMVMLTDDKDLSMLTYGPNMVNAPLRSGRVAFKSVTNYPFEDQVNIEFSESVKDKFKIYFRIPNWCDKASIKINGKRVKSKINDKGFVCVERVWSAGDKVALHFPMKIEVVESQEIKLLDPVKGKEQYIAPGAARVDTVADVVKGAPFAYVMRGPLLYALSPELKNFNEVKDPNWDYKYALNLKDSDFKVVTKPIDQAAAWSVSNPPITIETQAQSIEWNLTKKQPKMPADYIKRDASKMTTIELVPFGCTRFRVSAFPVVAK